MSKESTRKKTRTGDDTAAVYVFMAELDHPLKREIEAVRSIIRRADASIHESIKWNAPSFATTEYFATFKLRPGTTVEVVLHTGAKVKANPTAFVIDDPAGLVRWVTADRGVMRFATMQEVETHRDALTSIVRQWIAQM